VKQSPDLWWRRAALVSNSGIQYPLAGGGGDVPHALHLPDAVADREDMVVGFILALRELVYFDQAWRIHEYEHA
jgi:hypothetical protein